MSSSEIASCSSLPSGFTRRSLVKAGALGLSGGGLLSLDNLLAHQGAHGTGTARSVLLIFLSGGLSQLDSFDMKPEGPVDIRGEFRPIATQTPGMQICEHFPRLAQQTDKLALVRSLSHWSNEHNEAHTIMLTGRSELPPGYNAKTPQATDWPCMSSVAGRLLPPRRTWSPTRRSSTSTSGPTTRSPVSAGTATSPGSTAGLDTTTGPGVTGHRSTDPGSTGPRSTGLRSTGLQSTGPGTAGARAAPELRLRRLLLLLLGHQFPRQPLLLLLRLGPLPRRARMPTACRSPCLTCASRGTLIRWAVSPFLALLSLYVSPSLPDPC